MIKSQLTIRIQQAILEIRQRAADKLNEACASGVSVAQQLAPVDTGFLKSEIKQTEFATPQKLRAVMSSLAFYSVFVNFGTSIHAPNPYFTMGAISGAQVFTADPMFTNAGVVISGDVFRRATHFR